MTDERKSAASRKTPAKPSRLKKEDVRYLALEGGGGKGVTYLGAIQALEDLKILPINKPAGKNQILGIAGASAGAITALVLGLGYSSADLKKLLEDSEKFNSFFDGPFPGKLRIIDQQGKPQVGTEPGVDAGVVTTRQNALGDVAPIIISALIPANDDPIMKAIKQDVSGYLYNLIFDRGLFPGFVVTEFFRNLVRSYFDKQPKRKSAAANVDYGLINFRDFHEHTKVDLVFGGVNSTTKKAGIFSRQTTPLFPIAEAVGISMSIPILFKPVRIDPSLVFGPNYTGYWVDGGVQNNIPLHVFDDFNDNPNRSLVPGLSGLHPKVLALRLTPDPVAKTGLGPLPMRPLEQPYFQTFANYVSDVLESLMAPSEEGQIRTPQERSQTIELFTGELSLTEFAPPASKSEGPIKNAREVVAKYFAPK